MSYAPGPWNSKSSTGQSKLGDEVRDKNGWLVCVAVKRAKKGETAANARLIAQAPTMLKELKDMMWLANAAMLDANKCGCEYEIDEELKEARAIIRAAEGEE